MAKQHKNDDDGVTLSEAEVEILRSIIRDWINEDLVRPPYEEAVAAVFQKLGVGVPAARPQAASRAAVAAAPAPEEGAIPPPKPNLG